MRIANATPDTQLPRYLQAVLLDELGAVWTQSMGEAASQARVRVIHFICVIVPKNSSQAIKLWIRARANHSPCVTADVQAQAAHAEPATRAASHGVFATRTGLRLR